MANHTDMFSRILQMITEEEFRSFAIEYGTSHPEMVEAMERKYSKLLKGTEKIDMDKEVNACFEESDEEHYGRGWEPVKIDWWATKKNIRRLVKRAEVWAEGENPSQAIALALKLLEEIVRTVDAEMDWNDDFYPDDCGCKDVLALLDTATNNKLTSKADRLAIADSIDKICRTDAFDYDWDGGVIEEFAAKIRKENLTDDEQIEVMHRQYLEETREYTRKDKLREIWDFLMKLNRPADAEKLYLQNPDTDALHERYGLLLEEQKRDKEALEFYDSRLAKSMCDDRWLWGKWRIYKRNGQYDGMLDTLRRLFVLGPTRIDAYKELKNLVAADKWDDELQSLISKVYSEGEFDNLLGKILVAEHLIDQLYKRILGLRNDPLSYIESYKKHFSMEQLKALAMRMEVFLKSPHMHFRLERKGYRSLADHLKGVAKLCPAGEIVAKAAANYWLEKYSTRPALRDELHKAKLC